jgi:hypothetical protein
VQADSIVPQPGNPQALNRYSCVNNNPLRYVDPSGHYIQLEDEPEFAVRITGDGTIRVLRGGLWLRNAQELAWANYFLAGSSGPMPSLPGGVFGSTIVGSASNAAYAIGGQRAASSSGELVRDPLFIAGLAHMVGKVVETSFEEASAIAGKIAQQMTNPYGSPGGPAHTSVVAEIEAGIRARGLTPKREYTVNLFGPGTEAKVSRRVDVAALDVDRNPVEFHQVRDIAQSGLPVARKRRAIIDSSEFSAYTNVPLHFWAKRYR